MKMNRYTFLIALGKHKSQTVTYHGESEEDAREIALSALTDEDKKRVQSVSLLAKEES